MTKTQYKLDLAIKMFGIKHPFTLALSQIRDIELIEEQYNILREKNDRRNENE